jgi:hypothetical protein
MAFFMRIADGNCSVCFSNLGSDAVAHHDGGELHPIHRVCLETWLKVQRQRDQIPSCPDCRINVTSIESKEVSLIRLSIEGDLESVNVLLGDTTFFKNYDLAVLKASEAGQHQIVEALLEKGRISDSVRGRALEAASRNGSLELVESLIGKCGSNETVPTQSLEAALQIAREKGYQNIINRLEVRTIIRSIFGQNGDIRSEVFPERFL